MKFNNAQKAILALIIANTIWGAAAPIFKWSLENIQPFTLAFLRFGIAAFLLLPFLDFKALKIYKKDWWDVFLFSFSGITINISLFFLALQLTESINAPIIASSTPIFMILGGIFLLKEHPGSRKIYGGIIGLIGVLLIVLMPIIDKGFNGSVLGNVLLFISTLCSVHHGIALKKLSNTYKALPLLFWSFVIGTISFAPLVAWEVMQHGFLTDLTAKGLVGIYFGAFLSSAAAYYLFYFAMQHLLASEIGLFTYLDPVITILIAYPLLGEVPNSTFILGAILVFGGIYIAEGRLHYHPFHRLKKH